MIVSMTKYTFLLPWSNKSEFIDQIKELGMVDINRSQGAIDRESKSMIDSLTSLRNACEVVNNAKKTKDKATQTPLTVEQSLELAHKILGLNSTKDQLKQSVASLKAMRNDCLAWGEFSTKEIEKLAKEGLVLHPYTIPTKKFLEQWPTQYPLQIINECENTTYFIVIERSGEEFTFPLQEAVLPNLSVNEVDNQLEHINIKMQNIDQEIEVYTACLNSLKQASESISSHLESYLAKEGATQEVDGSIAIFTGFCPTEKDENLKGFLLQQCLYYMSEPAKEEDNPPISLKNNMFAKLFEPIGEMYMLPQYGESDLTAFFAPFYMLFFGMCLGDLGYGFLILLASIIGLFAMPKLKEYCKLGVWLGIGSLIMALLPGSLFGLKMKYLFPGLQDGSILSMTDIQMFWFAILFGIFQILFARLFTAIDTLKRHGVVASLAKFGWFFLILWCVLAYAGTMVPAVKMVPWLSKTMLYLGAALILFFSKTTGNIFGRLGSGLWAFYDITGVFGDVLSYIRLFGLGTSGGILAMVINNIALSLCGIPYVGYVFGVILLIFGHLLIFGLSALSAFVHPLRLTFVEFYKNASFTGGGREYRPLR